MVAVILCRVVIVMIVNKSKIVTLNIALLSKKVKSVSLGSIL
jgi:hypothetical protein